AGCRAWPQAGPDRESVRPGASGRCRCAEHASSCRAGATGPAWPVWQPPNCGRVEPGLRVPCLLRLNIGTPKLLTCCPPRSRAKTGIFLHMMPRPLSLVLRRLGAGAALLVLLVLVLAIPA